MLEFIIYSMNCDIQINWVLIPPHYKLFIRTNNVTNRWQSSHVFSLYSNAASWFTWRSIARTRENRDWFWFVSFALCRQNIIPQNIPLIFMFFLQICHFLLFTSRTCFVCVCFSCVLPSTVKPRRYLGERRSCERSQLASTPPDSEVSVGRTHVEQAFPLSRLRDHAQLPVFILPDEHLRRKPDENRNVRKKRRDSKGQEEEQV